MSESDFGLPFQPRGLAVAGRATLGLSGLYSVTHTMLITPCRGHWYNFLGSVPHTCTENGGGGGFLRPPRCHGVELDRDSGAKRSVAVFFRKNGGSQPPSGTGTLRKSYSV